MRHLFRFPKNTGHRYNAPANVAVVVSSLNLPLIHVFRSSVAALENFVTQTGADGMEYTFTRRSTCFARQAAQAKTTGDVPESSPLDTLVGAPKANDN